MVPTKFEREYPARLGICLNLLRKINQARRLGDWSRAETLLQELHLTEVRV
jgi:hypothetical protein